MFTNLKVSIKKHKASKSKSKGKDEGFFFKGEQIQDAVLKVLWERLESDAPLPSVKAHKLSKSEFLSAIKYYAGIMGRANNLSDEGINQFVKDIEDSRDSAFSQMLHSIR